MEEEESVSSPPPQLYTSIAYSNKKRKLQDEPLEIPFPKHVCSDQTRGQEPDFANRGESSDLESAKDSNSFHCNPDSTLMSTDDEVKNYAEYPEIYSPTSSEIHSHSSDSIDEYRSNCFVEHSREKELEDLLYSNGVGPSDYILSSGRWSVNRDGQEGGKKKLTIDKEFEQYFSTLML